MTKTQILKKMDNVSTEMLTLRLMMPKANLNPLLLKKMREMSDLFAICLKTDDQIKKTLPDVVKKKTPFKKRNITAASALRLSTAVFLVYVPITNLF